MAAYNNLSTSILTFGSELMAKLAAEDKNVCLSPFSVATCFAMLIEGADGETKNQLMNTFHFSADYLSQFELMLSIIDQSAATIRVANSLWCNEVSLNDHFVSTVLKHFKKPQISTVNFADEAAVVGQINAWANEKTNGYIPSVINKLNRNEILVLLNAVYFKGDWRSEFDAQRTCDGNFHTLDQGSVKVPMMSNPPKLLLYTSQAKFAVISLPYKGDDTSMFLILPPVNTKESLAELCSKEFLTEFFTTHRHTMKNKQVSVSMPKFKFENTFNLIPTLRSMGLIDAFCNRANFSELTAESIDVSLSQAVQKTFIEVDEKGTRAAAVTAVKCKSRKREVAINFVADRPFVFAIFHHVTELILFMGKVVNPPKNEKDTQNGKKRGPEQLNDEETTAMQSPNKKQKL